ncbi:MAG: hypothetical protein R3E96_08490 [Planctomycetota bacterium]
MARPLPSLLLACAAGILPSLALALPQGVSAAQIEADLDFARGLASQWGFTDLAESVLTGLEGQSLSQRQQDQLALVRGELYSQSARLERDNAKRNELYDRAIQEYKMFLSSRGQSTLREDAEASLVRTAYTYSRYLEQDLEDAVGDEAGAIKERMTAILTDAVSLTGAAIEGLKALGPTTEEGEGRTQRQTHQMFGLMLQRGEMLFQIAKHSTDPEYFYDAAMEALQELALEAGDGTPGAFYAFNTMGEIYLYRGEFEDAAIFFDAVLETTIPFDMAAWDKAKEELELAPPDVTLYFGFVEIAVDGSIQSYAGAGDDATAIARCMYFINVWKREGQTLTQNGQEAVLVAARTLLESNGFIGGDVNKGEAAWFASEEEMRSAVRSRRDQTDTTSFATALATEVNDTTAFPYLRVRAQKLLAEIAEMPGIQVSPELQMQALQGEYKSDNLDAAVDKAHTLIAMLQGAEDTTRLEYLPKLYNILGNIYYKQGRTLEAAMAFREGVAKYSGGDLAMDSSSAKAFNNLAGRLSEGNPALKSLVSEAEALVLKHSEGDSGDAIVYKRGEKLMREGKYEEAIQVFSQISLDSDYGELALVQAGVCHVRNEDLAAGKAIFERFRGEILKNPQYDRESTVGKTNRVNAEAIAEFYLGYCLQNEGDCDGAVALLTGYHTRHSSQTSLARAALKLVMDCQLDKGDVKAARATLETLEAYAPGHKVTSGAATKFYGTLQKKLDATKDPEARLAVLREMAERLQSANAGTDPAYGNLFREADHWYDLGEKENAERTLRRIISLYDGKGTDDQQKIDDFVKPRLAELLLAKKDVVGVSELLTPLILREIAASTDDKEAPKELRVSKSATITWAASLTGWLEGGMPGKPVIEVPGTGGDAALFDHATKKLAVFVAQTNPTYGCEWYAVKFQQIYAFYQWGKIDSSKSSVVGDLVRGLKTLQISGSDWEDVGLACEGSELESAGAVRSYYRWIEGRM